MKTPNQKAWWLVVPVVLLVAFNALLRDSDVPPVVATPAISQ